MYGHGSEHLLYDHAAESPSAFQGRRKHASSVPSVTATANQQHASLAVTPMWQQPPATRPSSSPFTDNDVAFLRSGGLTIEEDQHQNRRLDLSEKQILAIATDVDGTLLNSNQELSERTERALLLAQEQGVQVILATGKTRGPWVHDVISRLGLRTPGVFLQVRWVNR